mgnify:CR=1 FL=1
MACGVHDFGFDLRLFLCKRLGTYQRNVRGVFIGLGRRRHASAFGGDSFCGFVMVTVNLVIRLGIGSLWWKVIGLW